LPELIAFYADHAEHRDKFEVFAIHDDAVKSFAELDRKLASIKKQNWQGKELPFPILLDGEKKTHQLYAIRSWPTGLLIDPDGKLVGEASLGTLEAKLPPISVEKKWARHRDMRKNVFWSFEPKENTLNKFAETLKRWTECEITIDADAVKACGLTPDGPLPGVLIGSPITLRSIDKLMLAPHGLGLVPSTEAQTLVITRRSGAKDSASYFQKLHATELADRLDRTPLASESKEGKPLEIKNQPLLDAIKLVGREYNLPVGLDAKAMHTGMVDPESKVSGRIERGQLRKSLVKLLESVGLTVEVRDEVIMVIPTTR
jgi:hypothetical protein